MLPAWCRQPIDGFLEQKRRELREDGTIRSYRYSCIRFCRFLLLNRHESFEKLSPTDIKNFACQDTHTTFSGRASCFVIIRGFLRHLDKVGCDTSACFARITVRTGSFVSSSHSHLRNMHQGSGRLPAKDFRPPYGIEKMRCHWF